MEAKASEQASERARPARPPVCRRVARRPGRAATLSRCTIRRDKSLASREEWLQSACIAPLPTHGKRRPLSAPPPPLLPWSKRWLMSSSKRRRRSSIFLGYLHQRKFHSLSLASSKTMRLKREEQTNTTATRPERPRLAQVSKLRWFVFILR